MPEREEVRKYTVGDLIEVVTGIWSHEHVGFIPVKRHYLITEIIRGHFGRYRLLCIETNESRVEIFQYYDCGYGTKVN
jgi:hypothetical protein